LQGCAGGSTQACQTCSHVHNFMVAHRSGAIRGKAGTHPADARTGGMRGSPPWIEPNGSMEHRRGTQEPCGGPPACAEHDDLRRSGARAAPMILRNISSAKFAAPRRATHSGSSQDAMPRNRYKGNRYGFLEQQRKVGSRQNDRVYGVPLSQDMGQGRQVSMLLLGALFPAEPTRHRYCECSPLLLALPGRSPRHRLNRRAPIPSRSAYRIRLHAALLSLRALGQEARRY
jgi:hypothetical protein